MSLPLFDRPSAVDNLDGDRLARLRQFMRGRGQCRKALLAAHLGVSDRALRRIISSSDDIVATSSAAGYILVDEAPIDDVRHAAAELRSRARHLLNRAVAIERKAHHRLHVPADCQGAA